MAIVDGIGAQVQRLKSKEIGKADSDKVAAITGSALDTISRGLTSIIRVLQGLDTRIQNIEVTSQIPTSSVYQEVSFVSPWAPDFASTPRLKMTLTGDLTIDSPGSFIEGQEISLMLTQGPGAPFTWTFNTLGWPMPDGAFASPDPNTITIYTWVIASNVPRLISYQSNIPLT